MGSFEGNGFGIKYMIALSVLFFVVVCLGALRLWVLRRRAQREIQDIEAVAAASAERVAGDVRYLTSKRMEEESSKLESSGSVVEVSQAQSPPMAVAAGSPHPFLPSVFNDAYNNKIASDSNDDDDNSNNDTSEKTASPVDSFRSSRVSLAPSTSLAIVVAGATVLATSASTISSPLTASLPSTPVSLPKALSPPFSITSQRRITAPRLDTSTPTNTFLPPHELGTSSPSLEKGRLVVIPQRIKNIDLDFISEPPKAEMKTNLFVRRQQRQQQGSLSSLPVDAGIPASTRSSACMSSASAATELPDIPIVSPFRFSKPFDGVTINFDNFSTDNSNRHSRRKSSSCSGKIVIVEKEILPTPPTDDSRKSYIRSGVNVKYNCMTPIIENYSTKSFELSRQEHNIVAVNNNTTLKWVVDQQEEQKKRESIEKKPSITVQTVELQEETPKASPDTTSPDDHCFKVLPVEPKQLVDASAALIAPKPQLSNLTHQILTSVYPYFPLTSTPTQLQPAVEQQHKASIAGQSISDIYDIYAEPELSPILPPIERRQQQEEFRASTIGAAVSTGLWIPGPWVNFDGYELQSGNFPWKASFLMSSKPFEESPIGSVPSPCVDDFKCISPKSLTFDSEKCSCTPSPLPSPLPTPITTTIATAA